MNISKILRSISSFINKKNTNKTELDNPKISGFTIVEVMIVLAIAGLILAVVFVAVPALQRNQRNTARRGDLSYLRASLDTSIANNGGRLKVNNYLASIKGEELSRLGYDSEGNFRSGKSSGAFCADNPSDTDGDHTVATSSSACQALGSDSEPVGTWVTASNIHTPHANTIVIDSDTVVAGTKIAWGAGNNDGIVARTNHSCLKESTGLSGATLQSADDSDDLLKPGSAGSAAWLYKLEGEDILYCVDDVN